MDLSDVVLKQKRTTVDRLLQTARDHITFNRWSESSTALDAAVSLIGQERRETDDLLSHARPIIAAIESLKKENVSIREENARLKKYISEFKAGGGMGVHERTRWRKEVQAAEEQTSQLVDEITTIKKDRDEAIRVIAKRDTKIEHLQRMIREGSESRNHLRDARDQARSMVNKLTQKIIEIMPKNYTFVDPLQALELLRTDLDQWIGHRESLLHKERDTNRGGWWDDARGWVNGSTLKAKYPSKTLRCYSCSHQLEFSSPAQANQHGWRVLEHQAPDPNFLCQKPRCARLYISRLIEPKDFGWKSLHPVDVLVELGAVQAGSDFERDLRQIVWVRRGLDIEIKPQVNKEALRNLAADITGLQISVDPAKAGADHVSFGFVLPLASAPPLHPQPPEKDQCTCRQEIVRQAGVYREQGANWPCCNACNKYLAQPKEALLRRIIFRVP